MGKFIKNTLLGGSIFVAGTILGVAFAYAYKVASEEFKDMDIVGYEEDEPEDKKDVPGSKEAESTEA